METGNDIFSTSKPGISKVYFTLLCENENENDDVYSMHFLCLKTIQVHCIIAFEMFHYN